MAYVFNSLTLAAADALHCFNEAGDVQGVYEGVSPLLEIHRGDLEALVGMGLGHLPIDAVATPEDRPTPYHGGYQQQQCVSIVEEFEVAHRLTQFFPSFFVAALYELQSLLRGSELEGYVVGGIARDLLSQEGRKLQVEDVDITIRGDALACGKWIAEHSRNFELQEVYPEFGTAKVSYKDKIYFDLATTRREIYTHCGSLPEVTERAVPLPADLLRRDFTMNTLTLPVHDLGHVLDYTGGIADLEQQRIRVLHPVSFYEDPSRILRALKFAVRFDFELDRGTRRLLERFLAYAPLCHYRGGGARIKESAKAFLAMVDSPVKSRWMDYFLDAEVFHLFCVGAGKAQEPDFSVATAQEVQTDLSEAAVPPPPTATDLIRSFYPEPLPTEAIARQWRLMASRMEELEGLFELSIHESSDGEKMTRPEAWLLFLTVLMAPLSSAAFQEWSQQLGLTREERELVEAFRHWRESSGHHGLHWAQDMPPEEIYQCFHSLPELTAQVVVLLADPFQAALEAYRFYLTRLKGLQVSLNGKEIMALGVEEGEAVGAMRRELLIAKLNGRVKTRSDEMRFVRQALDLPLTPGLLEDTGSVRPTTVVFTPDTDSSTRSDSPYDDPPQDVGEL